MTVVGKQVYSAVGRQQWLSLLPTQANLQAELLYRQYDALEKFHKRAEKEMLQEVRRHSAYRLIQICPGLGKIRTAQLMSIA